MNLIQGRPVSVSRNVALTCLPWTCPTVHTPRPSTSSPDDPQYEANPVACPPKRRGLSLWLQLVQLLSLNCCVADLWRGGSPEAEAQPIRSVSNHPHPTIDTSPRERVSHGHARFREAKERTLSAGERGGTATSLPVLCPCSSIRFET